MAMKSKRFVTLIDCSSSSKANVVIPEAAAGGKKFRLLLDEDIDCEQFYNAMFKALKDFSNCAFIDSSCTMKIEYEESIKFFDIFSEKEPNVYIQSLITTNKVDKKDIVSEIYQSQDALVKNFVPERASSDRSSNDTIYAWDDAFVKPDGYGHKFLPLSLYLLKLKSEDKTQNLTSRSNLAHHKTFPTYQADKLKIDRTRCRSDHNDWPNGSCTKCMPKTVYLMHQKFRNIDLITFDNSQICNDFIGSWRESGIQKVGYLIGSIELAPTVSQFAIQARVSAIYEPKQVGSVNYIEINEDIQANVSLQYLLQKTDLQIVGVIFTDLVQIKEKFQESNNSPEKEPDQSSHLRNYRNFDTYLLTAEECILMAHHQLLFPYNPSWQSKSYIGSNFVTVVISSDEHQEISFNAYQVSDQCMRLHEANIILPTKDAPELFTTRTSKSKEDFVPDICFSMKIDGNNVVRPAKPCPVDFLYVTLPAVFNKVESKDWSLIESGSIDAELFREVSKIKSEYQKSHNLKNLLSFIAKFEERNKDKNIFKDFNLLNLICLADKKNLFRNVDKLIDYILNDNEEKYEEFLKSNLIMNLKSNSEGADKTWQCSHCTFINPPEVSNWCSVCGLPQ
ncbi:MAG: Nuclear protein localization protein 4 [Marteilia pararefringens]